MALALCSGCTQESPDDADTMPSASWHAPFVEVRDTIRFEPTRSPLRAPGAVVMGGHGNSLEQARLLAERLTAAGERVRLVEGVLEQTDAAALLAASMPDPVKRSLSDAVPVSDPSADPELLERVKRHYWVQLQQGEDWIDLDPSFPGSAPGTRYAEPAMTWDRLPPTRLPGVALRVDVERQDSAKETVLTWDGSLDAIANAPLALVVVAHIETADADGGAAPASRVFGIFGGGAPQEPTKRTRYLATLSNADDTLATGAFDLAGGAFDEAGVDAVERVTLQIEIRHPEDRRTRSTRRLFDADTDGARPPLFQRHSLLLTANRIPEAYLKETLAEILDAQDTRALRKRIDTLKETLSDGGDLAKLYAEAAVLEQQLGDDAGHLMNLVFASISDQLAEDMGRALAVLGFYDEPRILINTIQGNGKAQDVFMDLRQNTMTAVAYPGQALLMREALLYGRGVMDSVLEGLVVGLLTGEAPLTTATLMQKAADEGVPVALFSRLERSEITALDYPAATERRLLETLDAGQLVALPVRGIQYDERSRCGWWEIDPVTREAIGVLDTGLHQAVVEHTLIRSEGIVDDDMAWAIGALTGATDTHWALSAKILEHGELNKAALKEAKAYLKKIGSFVCSEIKVGKVWEEGVTFAEVKAEIEGCGEAEFSIGAGIGIGGDITILDKGWCDGFQKGFTCASMTILNLYLADL